MGWLAQLTSSCHMVQALLTGILKDLKTACMVASSPMATLKTEISRFANTSSIRVVPFIVLQSVLTKSYSSRGYTQNLQ